MSVLAPLQTEELRIEVTPADLPDDGFSDHVNNARYFAFINSTFRRWYVKMGIRGGRPGYGALMAHLSYDFLREVKYPGSVLCKLCVTQVGRSSLRHAVEIWDTTPAEPLLAGRGHAIHVWTERAQGKSLPWPAELLAQCWPGMDVSPAQDQSPASEPPSPPPPPSSHDEPPSATPKS